MPEEPAPTTARERARQAMVHDIVREARRQLAEHGVADLSLRSVARELGVVSSAVYRYVASRDDLLTLLIVDAYGRLADAAEAGAAEGGDDRRARWLGAVHAVRRWAARHPREHELLYGSPIEGYAAPPDTIEPATRLYRTLFEPVVGARRPRPKASHPIPPALAADAERVARDLDVDVPIELVVRVLGAWGTVLGMVSLERFGHTNNVITDHDAWFGERMEALADDLGL